MEGEKKLSRLPTLESSEVPTINLNDLISHNSQTRSTVVENLRQACKEKGFFQLTNHGISKRVIEDALGSSGKFFDLPIEEKNVFSSEDVYRPVRYAALRSNNVLDGGVLSREFMKLYAYPIEDCVDMWPGKPAAYREKLGKYATDVRRVYITVMGAIMESLGLTPNHLRESIEHGMQMLAINRYPQCFSSTNLVGISSHTDHSIVTILVESTPRLEILDSRDHSWKLVPAVEKCSLIVLVGNHLEVISNGLYKSAVHKVVQSPKSGRVSIGSFHSLPMEEMVEPAVELLDKENPKRYMASSLSDYIKFLSSKEAKPYIDSLKI